MYGKVIMEFLSANLTLHCCPAGLSAILILYLWGSCIAYLVIIGDSFSPLIALATGDGSVLADRRLVIATLGLLVVLPLCFPRELGALAWVSMAAVRLRPLHGTLKLLPVAHAGTAAVTGSLYTPMKHLPRLHSTVHTHAAPSRAA